MSPIQLTAGRYFGHMEEERKFSFFSCSITRYQPYEKIAPHCHDNPYLSMLLGGRYSETSGSRPLFVDRGEAIFRPGGYEHANSFEHGYGTCFNIEIHQPSYAGYIKENSLPIAPLTYRPGMIPSVYTLLYYFRMGADPLLIEELAISWLLQIGDPPANPSSLPWLEKVLQILDNESNVYHTLEALSGRVFVHPVYLARAFKERIGITAGQYQLKKKLERAMHLLHNSSHTVTDIAYTCGFSDPAHLVRSFRLLYGQTPRKLRSILHS